MTTRKRPSRARKTAATADADAPAGAPEQASPPARRPRRARQRSVGLRQNTPTIGTTRATEPKTKVRPQPGFWLVFNRSRWDVIGGRVVPALSQAKILPGANGVGRRSDDDVPLPAMMLAQIEENGHQVIPWDVDGPGTSYLRQDPATGGWYTRWETVFPGSDVIQSDTEGYSAWLASLIERGVIEPPPIYVLKGLLSRYERMQGEAIKMGGADTLVKRYTDALLVIRAELATAEAEADEEALLPPDAPMPDVAMSGMPSID